MDRQMSKFDDAARGLYFRKSKQEQLEHAIARIELAQRNSKEAITRIETAQRNFEQAVARIESRQTNSLSSAPMTIDSAIDAAISSGAPTISAHNENDDTYRRWYDGMEFSEDWTSGHFGIWAQIFDDHGKSFRKALEIGSFEGRSAIFFLEYLPKLHLTCVDLFEYNDKFFPQRRNIETEFAKGLRFDKNLNKYAGRYEKIVSPSAKALAEFASKGRRFDFIYIDGSHYRDDVLIDAFLSWNILNDNGVMIFDDYQWNWQARPAGRPKEAIEYFVYSHLDDLEILHKGIQFIVKKVK
jgi:predicted O-methyltransferase YrrM